MIQDKTPATPSSTTARRAWRAPVLEVLPELKELTLQSPIWGGEGGFGYLDATRTAERLG